MHAHTPNTKFMVMAETSIFDIFRGWNVRGRNVRAETSVARNIRAAMKTLAMLNELIQVPN